MSLILHKVLPLLILPFSLSFVLLLSSILLRRRLLAVIGIICLYISSTPLLSDSLLRNLENRVPATSLAECRNADAIVILGGMVGESEHRPGRLEWGSAVDRFEEAIELFRAGKAKLMIVPAGRTPWSGGGRSEGELLTAAAVAHGIPQASIVITRPVENTLEEASAVRDLLRSRLLGSVIVVTTAWHMPRALMLFRRTGLDVIPFPVDYETSLKPGPVPSFIPQSGALAQTDKAVREYIGLFYYQILR